MTQAHKTSVTAAVPNDLEAFFMPFTANRAFKARPRLIARAKDMHYYAPDGRAILDGAAGLWCTNAGHNRDPIVQAIQAQAATLDFAPTFQLGHPRAFELASRIAALAPGDLDQVFFCNSGSEGAVSLRRWRIRRAVADRAFRAPRGRREGPEAHGGLSGVTPLGRQRAGGQSRPGPDDPGRGLARRPGGRQAVPQRALVRARYSL